MENRLFIRLDGDNIGDGIELAVMNGELEKAQQIHDSVQDSMKRLTKMISDFPTSNLLLIGCDDILFSIEGKQAPITLLDELRTTFQIDTYHSLSIGVGTNLPSALTSLKRAKLSGKDKVIMEDGIISSNQAY